MASDDEVIPLQDGSKRPLTMRISKKSTTRSGTYFTSLVRGRAITCW
jgi:hypothetical protein